MLVGCCSDQLGVAAARSDLLSIHSESGRQQQGAAGEPAVARLTVLQNGNAWHNSWLCEQQLTHRLQVPTAVCSPTERWTATPRGALSSRLFCLRLAWCRCLKTIPANAWCFMRPTCCECLQAAGSASCSHALSCHAPNAAGTAQQRRRCWTAGRTPGRSTTTVGSAACMPRQAVASPSRCAPSTKFPSCLCGCGSLRFTCCVCLPRRQAGHHPGLLYIFVWRII